MGADRKDLLLRVLTSLFQGSLLPSYSGGTWQPAPTFAHTNPTLSAETPQKVPSGDGRDGVVGGLHQPSAGGLRCKEGARREVLQHSCTAELALPGGARPASVLKQKEARKRRRRASPGSRACPPLPDGRSSKALRCASCVASLSRALCSAHEAPCSPGGRSCSHAHTSRCASRGRGREAVAGCRAASAPLASKEPPNRRGSGSARPPPLEAAAHLVKPTPARPFAADLDGRCGADGRSEGSGAGRRAPGGGRPRGGFLTSRFCSDS